MTDFRERFADSLSMLNTLLDCRRVSSDVSSDDMVVSEVDPRAATVKALMPIETDDAPPLE